VLVISLDGARPDALQQVYTPHIDALAARGAVMWEARTTFPPATVQAHASMLTGLDVDEHGVTWNAYSTEMLDPDQAPTFLTTAARHGYKAGMVVGKNKLQQFQQIDAVAFQFATRGDRSVVDGVIDMLDADYDVIFAHFPNPDYFGHSSGWMSEIYLNQLTHTDREIGRLVAALEHRDLLAETLIILTADHGGTGTSHGQDIPEHMQIPWLAAGPGVRAGVLLDEPVPVTATAATALCALRLPPPPLAEPPVETAFERLHCESS
jgi:predicted AlkP superfamily pyrophosphatase or phosphodiesterase